MYEIQYYSYFVILHNCNNLYGTIKKYIITNGYFNKDYRKHVLIKHTNRFRVCELWSLVPLITLYYIIMYLCVFIIFDYVTFKKQKEKNNF